MPVSRPRQLRHERGIDFREPQHTPAARIREAPGARARGEGRQAASAHGLARHPGVDAMVAGADGTLWRSPGVVAALRS